MHKIALKCETSNPIELLLDLFKSAKCNITLFQSIQGIKQMDSENETKKCHKVRSIHNCNQHTLTHQLPCCLDCHY